MSQRAYNLYQGVAFPGLKGDLGDDYVETKLAVEEIAIGLAVVKCIGRDNYANAPSANKSVVTDSGGTYTAGSIIATVNGTAVTQTYDTDKDTTLTALAAKIAALDGMVSCVYSAGSHTITAIYGLGELTITMDISGITGTMTISSIVASQDSQDIEGVIIHSQAIEQTYLTGTVTVKANGVLNVLRRGLCYVKVEEAVTSDSPVYVRFIADTNKPKGGFRASSDSGKAVAWTGAKYKTSADADGTALIEFNLP